MHGCLLLDAHARTQKVLLTTYMHSQECGDDVSHSCEFDGEPLRKAIDRNFSRTNYDEVNNEVNKEMKGKNHKSNMRYLVHGQTGECPVGCWTCVRVYVLE